MSNVLKQQLKLSLILGCVITSASADFISAKSASTRNGAPSAVTVKPQTSNKQGNTADSTTNTTNLVTTTPTTTTLAASDTSNVNLIDEPKPKPPIENTFLNCYAPYVGIDFALTNQNFQTGFGKKVFLRYPKEYSGFIGINIVRYIGIELGYVEQPSQVRNPELVAGDSYPGGPKLSTGQFAYLQTSLRVSSPYAGLSLQTVANVQGLGTTKFQLILAAAAEKFKAGEGTLRDQTGVYTIPQYNASYRGFDKTKVVPMVKFAVTVMATDYIGVRAAATYRGTGHMTIYSEQSSSTQVKMRDTLCIGLGVVYSFGVVQPPC